MVLSVFRRIHWGMGLFCFWALASFCLVRNDLWDCRNVSTACSRHAGVALRRRFECTYRHLDGVVRMSLWLFCR
jgi:hypothetical protein